MLCERREAKLGPWSLVLRTLVLDTGFHLNQPFFGFQIGHRDFDVEKRLRRDLRRTHALLSDVQLLLATMEDSKTSVSKEELEKVHSQVRSEMERSSSEKHSQRLCPPARKEATRQ